MMWPAVFLDRDGTLIEEVGYCSNPADVRVYEGVVESLNKLREAGFLVIVITNQSGIGYGYFSEADYHAVNEEMTRQLAPFVVDGTYFSVETPEKPGPRRKPNPGMVLEAAAEFEIDLAQSYFVGDREGDVLCGKNAGTRTVLVTTGYGDRFPDSVADYRASGMVDAVEWLLKDTAPRK